MAQRQHLITRNLLSITATSNNIAMMRPDTHKRYCRQDDVEFENTADSESVLTNARWFIETVKDLSQNPMETIPEEEAFGAASFPRKPTEKEKDQIKQAIKNTRYYEKLRDSRIKIENSFRTRLDEIYPICHGFICISVGNHTRPTWAQICRVDREVTNHVARVQQQLTSDVTNLREFLRDQLFDQYCLMRETSQEKKTEIWLIFGRCIVLGRANSKCEKSLTGETAKNVDLGNPQVQGRLDRMIESAGLDPEWVKDHIEDYHEGNKHIGQWQRYINSRRWRKLAAKLSMDIQQLKKINSSNPSNGRPCKIMPIIVNTKRQYFIALDGALGYELTDKARRMGEEDEGYESSSSSSSSTTSLVAVS